MAEQSKPNTFTGGMKTDLDPGFQPKDSYFTGLNVRVITNGSNSYSLENIKGPAEKSNLNVSSYRIHGAVIVGNDIITIQKLASTFNDTTWKIYKNSINSDFTIGTASQLWSGAALFSDFSGKIEIESIIETENTHRIYCTDGITGLKSINIKDANIASKTASDFEAFKPNVKSGISLVKYNETGGNLKYGSYSYVYRLGSQNQSNYSDWSSASRPINIVKNSLVNNTSLGVSGGTSSDNSSAALDLTISNVSQDFEQIQIAVIYYSSENISTINIIEEGSITSTTYNFTHSGFETETLVEGGIASAIISNETWNICKSLAQKDNKLYAGNLKSTIFDVESTISSFGKLKSYKGVQSGSNWTLETWSGDDENPHRHYNGSGGSWSWDDNLYWDKQRYKFINKNFNTSSDPVYVLGAETENYSTGSYGFRLTFTQKEYLIDERFNQIPGGGTGAPETDRDANKPYFISSSQNDNSFGGFKKGPHNPFWDSKYRSFKRGECYRFGIVFYDKQGTPGFTYHLGDVKMPDALDPNSKVLNSVGNSATAVDKTNHSYNSCWSPFSGGANDDEVYGYALIPKIEVRLPSSVTSIISGYKIVRAELTDNDKTIITQGMLSTTEHYHEDQGDNTTLEDKTTYPPTSLQIVHYDGSNNSGYAGRIPYNQFIIDGTDTTLRGINYNFSSGFAIRPLYPIKVNKVHTYSNSQTSNAKDHKFFGYDVKSNMDSGGQDGVGFGSQKWKPWPRLLESSTSLTTKSDLQNNGNENLFRWTAETYLAKTVVNAEIISTTQSNLPRNYIHKSAGYRGSDQFDNDTGDFYPPQYDEKSRAKYSLDVNPSLYISTGQTGANIPTLAGIKFDSTTGKSLHQYPSSSPNNYASQVRSNGSHSYRFLGFKWMGELIRNTSSGFEQYGGTSAASIENTRFYDCSEFKSTLGTAIRVIEITFGDVFCDWYTIQNTSRGNTEDTYVYGSTFPVESFVNTALRQGTYFGTSEIASMTTADNFLYNTAYNQENNLISSVVKPTSWVDNDLFKSKIAASKTKILGESLDAWSIFPSNDFIELSLSNGELTDLINYKNQLYAIQESGMSLLSVNSRALIQGEGAAADIQIVSGTGTAIERYDYLTDQYGSQHYNQSIITPNAFYFYDELKKEIIRCDGQSVVPVAYQNNYKNYLTNISGSISKPTNGLGNLNALALGYDAEFRECHFMIKSNNTDYNFVISDLDGKLISTLNLIDGSTLNFNYYLPYNGKIYGVNTNTTSSTDKLYLLNSGNYQAYNFGFVVNDSAAENKVFDVSEIVTDKATAFTNHVVQGSVGDAQTITETTIREGIHKVPLRSGSNPRIRGNWMKHTISYSTLGEKFNIFAVNTRIRKSR